MPIRNTVCFICIHIESLHAYTIYMTIRYYKNVLYAYVYTKSL